VIYLKWKLSDDGVWGTGPEETIAGRGGLADASWAVDATGYRIGYLAQTADLTGLETWDVTELTEAQALTFCQQFYADAEVLPDGRISSPPPPDDV
jgi:hypothetical protein|tara:strand:+ start:1941 stop:2228 length:288 start_codon:yes stop_codon:yes gene_type:complete